MNLPVLTKRSETYDFNELADQVRKVSVLLKALSHEVRLLMLCLLSDGEKSVSELEALLAMPQAAVSQQLARLRMEGLVVARRDGRQIYYSLVDDEVQSAILTLYDLFCQNGGPDRS